MIKRKPVSPLVDFVFKILFGTEENKDLLIDLLNSILSLQGEKRITSVELLNPYSDKEFEGDKLSIVDVKAKDSKENIYQIEMQLSLAPSLPMRMAYLNADLYSAQLKSGKDFALLKPVISIWIFNRDLTFDCIEGEEIPRLLVGKKQLALRKNRPKNGSSESSKPAPFHHHFQLYDVENHRLLTPDCSIHLIELPKWNKLKTHPSTQLDNWCSFFLEGEAAMILEPEEMKEIPEWMTSPEIKQAISALQTISEKEATYHLYQSRLNFLRDQRGFERGMEELKEENETAVKEKKAAIQREEAAVEEKEKLKAKNEQLRLALQKAGIQV